MNKLTNILLHNSKGTTWDNSSSPLPFHFSLSSTPNHFYTLDLPSLLPWPPYSATANKLTPLSDCAHPFSVHDECTWLSVWRGWLVSFSLSLSHFCRRFTMWVLLTVRSNDALLWETDGRWDNNKGSFSITKVWPLSSIQLIKNGFDKLTIGLDV